MSTEPKERFSNRAEDYRHHRPGYPSAVIELMRTEGGLVGAAAVADVGSGTGIFTRLLLQAGFNVTAVEPNGPMRKAAEEDLSGFAGFRSVNAPAENTGLPSGTFDAITVAQAFHWFDPEASRREFRRLLRSSGWIFIVRNQRQIDTTPFLRGYEALLKSLGEPYENVVHRDQHAGEQNRRILFGDGSMQVAHYPNPHSLDWPALRGRFLSSSYVPARGEAAHDELLAKLEELFRQNEWDGRVVLDQSTEVFYGPV